MRSMRTVRMTMAGVAVVSAVAAAGPTWERLPELPPGAGQAVQPGVAGPFAGAHGGALLVGGGANFPGKLPWDGGAKVWWDDLWVLEDAAGAKPRWVRDKRFKLPGPRAHGASFDTAEGTIWAGGNDAERCYAEVYRFSWDAAAREVRRTELPPLPEPLALMAGARVGRMLFVAGGQTTMADPVATKAFFALDLGRPPAERRWEALPAWPGPARVLAVAAGQRGKNGDAFYLFGGRRPEAGKPTRLLSDAYAFDVATRTWRVLPPVGDGRRSGLSAMAATAAAVGESEVWLFGGDRGDVFLELEAHDLAIAELRAAGAGRPDAEAAIAARLAAKRAIQAVHPGFAREVLAFETRTETWRVATTWPADFGAAVTTTAVTLGGAVLLPSGETKPGVRTREVVRVGKADRGK